MAELDIIHDPCLLVILVKSVILVEQRGIGISSEKNNTLGFISRSLSCQQTADCLIGI